MHELFCTMCGTAFKAIRPDKRYCSPKCQNRQGRLRRGEQTDVTKHGRDCGICHRHFHIQPPNSNQRYCSTDCAAQAAKIQRRAFHRKNPLLWKVYNARRPYRDSVLARLRRKYPSLPTSCQSCGEARVLEVAHKPGHERRGAWRVMRNCAQHMIWILCPTCHKLVDKGISTPTELGLS